MVFLIIISGDDIVTLKSLIIKEALYTCTSAFSTERQSLILPFSSVFIKNKQNTPLFYSGDECY